MLHEMGRRLRRKSTCLVIMRVWVQSPEPTGYGGMWCNPSIEEVETGRTWGLIGQSTISSQWSPCQGRILPHKTRHKQTKNSGVDNEQWYTKLLSDLHTCGHRLGWIEHIPCPMFCEDIHSQNSSLAKDTAVSKTNKDACLHGACLSSDDPLL